MNHITFSVKEVTKTGAVAQVLSGFNEERIVTSPRTIKQYI
jgi:hypothetical protein